MTEQSRIATTLAVIALTLGACVGNSSDQSDSDLNTLEGYVLLSDGTPGGDLIELEMRHTVWSCDRSLTGDVLESCWNDPWPEGRGECLRDAINEHFPANEPSIACVTATYESQAECLMEPWVIPFTCFTDEARVGCPATDDALRWAVEGCYDRPSDNRQSWTRPRD